jgi:hypothetical protein
VEIEKLNLIYEFGWPNYNPVTKVSSLIENQFASDKVKKKAASCLEDFAINKHKDAFLPLARLYFDGSWLLMNYVAGFKWLVMAKKYLPQDKKPDVVKELDAAIKAYGQDCLLKGMIEAQKTLSKWRAPKKSVLPA